MRDGKGERRTGGASSAVSSFVSSKYALSAHVWITGMRRWPIALGMMKYQFETRFALAQTPLQLEAATQAECGERSCGPEIRA
jgi:hypothetical protein